MSRTNQNEKVALVSACGGHLTELRALRAAYAELEHFYVLNDNITLPEDMKNRTYVCTLAERNWKVLLNFYEAWTILRTERPDVILSTGSGVLVPFAIVAKVLGIPVIFVEISAQVNSPSLTGRFMRVLADRIFYSWKPLGKFYTRGTYGGLLV